MWNDQPIGCFGDLLLSQNPIKKVAETSLSVEASPIQRRVVWISHHPNISIQHLRQTYCLTSSINMHHIFSSSCHRACPQTLANSGKPCWAKQCQTQRSKGLFRYNCFFLLSGWEFLENSGGQLPLTDHLPHPRNHGLVDLLVMRTAGFFCGWIVLFINVHLAIWFSLEDQQKKSSAAGCFAHPKAWYISAPVPLF